jgi:hypothetical protein
MLLCIARRPAQRRSIFFTKQTGTDVGCRCSFHFSACARPPVHRRPGVPLQKLPRSRKLQHVPCVFSPDAQSTSSRRLSSKSTCRCGAPLHHRLTPLSHSWPEFVVFLGTAPPKRQSSSWLERVRMADMQMSSSAKQRDVHVPGKTTTMCCRSSPTPSTPTRRSSWESSAPTHRFMRFSVSFSHVLLPLFVCFVCVFFVRGGQLVAHFCDTNRLQSELFIHAGAPSPARTTESAQPSQVVRCRFFNKFWIVPWYGYWIS